MNVKILKNEPKEMFIGVSYKADNLAVKLKSYFEDDEEPATMEYDEKEFSAISDFLSFFMYQEDGEQKIDAGLLLKTAIFFSEIAQEKEKNLEG